MATSRLGCRRQGAARIQCCCCCLDVGRQRLQLAAVIVEEPRVRRTRASSAVQDHGADVLDAAD
eukprot:5723879-Alexandrium_andersonii.AAC.1